MARSTVKTSGEKSEKHAASDVHGIWSGLLTFGLVSMPVTMVTAVRSRRSSFHLLHRTDHSRLQRRMYCPEHGTYVHPEHMLRGAEVEPGKHVIVLDSEIEAIEPKRSKSIEVTQFVDADEISPLYYDRPYYLVPKGAEKPYRLLVETLADLNKAGLAEFVLHARERLVAVRSIDGVLCLVLLHYQQELQDVQDVLPEAEAQDRDVEAIRKAIAKCSAPFKPGDLEDKYQQRVDQLIKRKQQHHETVQAPQHGEQEQGATAAEEAEDTNLMDVLEASMARAKQAKGG